MRSPSSIYCSHLHLFEPTCVEWMTKHVLFKWPYRKTESESKTGKLMWGLWNISILTCDVSLNCRGMAPVNACAPDHRTLGRVRWSLRCRGRAPSLTSGNTLNLFWFCWGFPPQKNIFSCHFGWIIFSVVWMLTTSDKQIRSSSGFNTISGTPTLSQDAGEQD